MTSIRIGYEVGTGDSVEIPNRHLIVTGLTQLSGKTSTLQALITRGQIRAIAFRTKRGELGFTEARHIPPFFKERTDWQAIQALLEATMRERLKFERSWIIKVSKGATSLKQVRANVAKALEKAKGLSESVYTNLAAYLDILLPQIEKTAFATSLHLEKAGLHVMDLEALTSEMQALVIESVMNAVMDAYRDTVVVIPEAWTFLPQRRGNPVKWAAERFIRQGAVLGNYLWLDSQDIAGVDKSILKQVDTWILGRQREANEVERTLRQLPVPKSIKPKPEEVMNLPVGHFYVCFEDIVKKVYVQPAWLSHQKARAVALGDAGIPEYTPPQEDEELQWKTKYQELQKAHEAVSQELKELKAYTESLEHSVEDLSEKAVELKEANDALKHNEAQLASLKAFREAMAEFVQDLGVPTSGTPNPRDSQEEAHLTAHQEIGSLEVQQHMVRYEAHDGDYRGRLAILIAEGLLDEPTKALPILREMESRGWGSAKSGGTRSGVYRELAWFTEKGFLRFVKTPGKKEGDEWVVLPEAKKRIRVAQKEVAV